VRFHIEQDFAGPLEAVESAFVDPELLDRIGELPKLGRPELLSQDKTADTVHQRVRYRFSGELSSAARRVLDPGKLTWVEDSVLDRRTHRTTWTIVPDNYAGRLSCSGTFTLLPRGDAATRRVTDGDVRVSFPLVGSRVERAIVSGLAEHAELEVGVVDAWLADQNRP
jgi:hypothetical protein